MEAGQENSRNFAFRGSARFVLINRTTRYSKRPMALEPNEPYHSSLPSMSCSRRVIPPRVPRTMRMSPARRRSSAEGVVSKLPSMLRVARIMAPVLSPIRSSPIVRPAMEESFGTLNSSRRNSIPSSARVTRSRKSTMRGWVASEASLRPPTA